MNEEELNRPVSFSGWRDALASDPEVGLTRQEAFRRAIVAYLMYLKDRHTRASLASAKAYFDAEKSEGHDREEEREAVRWFFRAAKRRETEGDVGREESGVGERGGKRNAERLRE